MDREDDQLLRRRAYGADHDDSDLGPLSHRTYAEPVGCPLPDITAWRDEEVDGGVPLSTELVRWPGGRALYDPRPGERRSPGPGVSCRFHHSGDTP
ncbi:MULTISPECIES: hypothetical protein [Streptomyces]|uniref:Uncharacterized protein n=1 Tax=Streptomyces eurythermus TaxID=42237 RepID=A0ABW6YTG3_9ACTN|nr:MULTISPECIES: hypothetical protein [Streptomyces]QIS68869.1 hypothetical protein HB370_01710 [Streptomyces sp. DSM 40868]